MRSSALNIKAVSWKIFGVLCVYRNDSLYVDNPENGCKLEIPKHWHAPRQLCIFWLHFNFIYLLLFIWVHEDSFCCSEQGK